MERYHTGYLVPGIGTSSDDHSNFMSKANGLTHHMLLLHHIRHSCLFGPGTRYLVPGYSGYTRYISIYIVQLHRLPGTTYQRTTGIHTYIRGTLLINHRLVTRHLLLSSFFVTSSSAVREK